MKKLLIGVSLMAISEGYVGDSVHGAKMERFYKRYVGLGDSISIDEYAGGPGWGAISLFHRNKDEVYPEWKGRDLRSRYPGIDFHSLASDGATSTSVAEEQLPALPTGDDDPTVVTLTIGGNDFLSLLGAGRVISGEAVDRFRLNLGKILTGLRHRYPDCTIILGTIYDPTDGVGDLGIPEVDIQEAYELFHAFNNVILELGKSYGAQIADIYSHFLGHGSHSSYRKGLTSDNSSYWYTQEIEPNARGAHEIRRLFWEALHWPLRGDD